jgi:5-methylcytosine-specific restriction endonuclease McrA
MTNKLPVADKKIKSMLFNEYLDLIGADQIQKTSDWEEARFIANDIICVVYKNKKGRVSYSNETAQKVYIAYEEGRRINIQSVKRKSLGDKFKEKIIARDGHKCFYSNIQMTYEESTIEHLIPLCKGGKNNLDNLVLCLKEENQRMADKPLIEKINYKIENDK